MTRLRAVAVLAGVLALSGVLGSAASASDVADVTISPDKPRTVQKYSGIPLSVPEGTVATPSRCRVAAPYCDVIDVKLELPPGYDPNENPYGISLKIAWPDEVTDLDAYLYDKAEKEVGAHAQGATASNPERVAVGWEIVPPGTYQLVVLNFAGINEEYTLTADFVDEGALPPLPSTYRVRRGGPSSGPSQPFGFGSPSGGTRGGGPGSFTDPDTAGGTDPRPVPTYGADGAPELRSLNPLGVSRESEPRRSNLAFYIILAVMVVAVGAGAFVFWRKQRGLFET